MPRIQRRLLVALGALVIAVSGLSGWWIDHAVRARERAHIESWLESSARTVAELVRDASFDPANRTELAELALRAAAASGARVTLIATDGTVVADSEVRPQDLDSVANHAGRPEVAAALAGHLGSNTRRSETVGRPFLYLALPRAAPSPPGVVRVAADLTSVDAAIGELRSVLLAGGVIALVAALVLSFLLSRALLRPLWIFQAALARLAAGDLGARVHWRANDELGDLARGSGAVKLRLPRLCRGKVQGL